jgi:hypothetical protein
MTAVGFMLSPVMLKVSRFQSFKVAKTAAMTEL